MNYLAHAYLSFQNPAWVTGNLVSDFVKGKKKFDYPVAIQQGIALHRGIDEFTDSHEIIKEAKEIFRPHYRLYAGAFVDVSMDHFLATDVKHFANEADLTRFSQFVYKSMLAHYKDLPVSLHGMYDRMREQDWLSNYRYNWGMEKSFAGVVYRSKYLEESATAFKLFKNNKEQLKAYYNQFFPQLSSFTEMLAKSFS